MAVISVIIPAYNQAAYLGEAIQSVLDQTFSNFEILIVDDGSTDKTAEVALSYPDSRIHYIHQKNRGLSAARNTGFRLSSGELIAFLDSDDLLLPHNFASQQQLLEEQPQLGMVIGGWRSINEAGKAVHEALPWEHHPELDLKAWLQSSHMAMHAILIRRAWIEKVGGFDEKFRRLEDWDFGLRLAYANCPMGWNRQVIALYRLHAENMTRDAVAQGQAILAVLDKFYANPNLPAEALQLKQPVYAQGYLRSAARAYGAGELLAAQADLEHAVQLDPNLLANGGQPILEHFAGWALQPMVDDPASYLTTVFSNLPDAAASLRHRRHQTLALVWMSLFYRAAKEADHRQVRRCFIQAISNDPGWLLNRGVIVILLRSLR